MVKYPSMKFMVEDNRDIANMVSSWGYKVYLIDNQYNSGEIHKNVVRLTKEPLFELMNIFFASPWRSGEYIGDINE